MLSHCLDSQGFTCSITHNDEDHEEQVDLASECANSLQNPPVAQCLCISALLIDRDCRFDSTLILLCA